MTVVWCEKHDRAVPEDRDRCFDCETDLILKRAAADKPVWGFVDMFEAFPTLYPRPGGHEVGDVNICLGHRTGGGVGEFSIRWYTLGRDACPKLEAFSDSWKVLVASRVLGVLERYDTSEGGADRLDVATLKAELLGLGFEDWTDAKGRAERLRP